MSWGWPDSTNRLEEGGIRLEPLSLDHIPGLMVAAATSSEHEVAMGFVPRATDMAVYVNRALSEKRAGRSFPFAVCLDSGQPIGTSWFRVFDPWRKKLEIGFTWYGTPYRKGTANLQTKLLLMTFAFEELRCILVEFIAHKDNHPSRRAISALGAREDGTLRKVIPMADGTFGDVILYSVSDDEWPTVKATVSNRLANRRAEKDLGLLA